LGGRLRHGQCIAVKSAGNLPCKYVLNTNAPGRSNPDTLRQCYESAIEKAIELNLSTLVFACLGTGGKGFYPDAAAQIAIQSVASFMKNHLDSKVPIVNRVIH